MKRKVLLFLGMLSIALLVGATATVALYELPSVPGITGVTTGPGGVLQIGTAPAPAAGGGFVANIDAAALPHIRDVQQQGGRVAVFAVATPPLSTTETNIPVNVLREATGMAVRVQTSVAAVEVSPSLVTSLGAANRPLSIVISSPSPQAIDAVRPTGTERVGSPISVQANFTGDMLVTIPLGLFVPTEPQARAAFLGRLRVLSAVDGAGTVQSALTFTIDEAAVPPVLTGVTFTTNRSGLFSVIR